MMISKKTSKIMGFAAIMVIAAAVVGVVMWTDGEDTEATTYYTVSFISYTVGGTTVGPSSISSISVEAGSHWGYDTTNNQVYFADPNYETTTATVGPTIDGWSMYYCDPYSGTVNSNTTITLSFEYNSFGVSYFANISSGAESSIDTQYVNYLNQSSYTFTVLSTTPTRGDDYTFLGWATSKTATAAEYQAGDSLTVSDGGNFGGSHWVRLYAVWQAPTAVTVILQFSANGGSGAPGSLSTTTTSSTVTFTIPSTTPTRSGYTFMGWGSSSTSTTVSKSPGDTVTFSVYGSSTNTHTYYALWGTEFTLIYNMNGGSGGPATKTGLGVGSLTFNTYATPFPTRTGYEFLGWGETASSTIESGHLLQITLYEANPTGTVYAIWRTNTYTVDFSSNILSVTTSPSSVTVPYDGTWTYSNNTITFYDPSQTLLSTVTINPGNYTVENISGTASGTIQAATTLEINCYWYAYSLEYIVPEGTTNTPTDQSVGLTYSSTYIFTIGSETPAYSDWTFLNWSYGGATYQPGDSVTVTGTAYTTTTAELSSGWTALEWYTYTLTYNANGGSGAPATEASETTHNTVWPFTISDTTPTRSGYTFMGWAESSSATTAEYQPGDIVYVPNTTLDLTIYAVWGTTFTLNYSANGGSGAPATDTQIAVNSYTFTISEDTPTRSGHVFSGWGDTSSATAASYQPGGSVTLTRSESTTKTLYAIWTAGFSYTLSYSANGGSGAPATQTTTGTEISYNFTIPSTTPTRSHYTFMGWSTAASAASPSYAAGATVTVGANQTVTLYAVWQEDSSVSLSLDNVIKTIGQTFFGGSSTVAGLAIIVVAWLVCVAILANIGASPVFSVVPMIPIIIIFAAYNVVSAEVSIIIILMCAILSATTVRGMIKG